MSHGLVLLVERLTILIVVGAVLYKAANLDKLLGKIEITRISRLTPHLNHTHIVTGADGTTGEFGRSRLVEVDEEVGGLDSAIEERGLSRGTLVDDGCHHQVAQVVGLEVETIGKGSLLVLLPYCGADDGLLFLHRVTIDATIHFVDDDGRMDIAILALCSGYTVDEMVHQAIKFRIAGDSINGSHAFEPLVHIAIVERRAPVLVIVGRDIVAGSNLEIAEAMRDGRVVPGLPHRKQRRAAVHAEAVAPEATGPLCGSNREVRHNGMRAAACVSKRLAADCRLLAEECHKKEGKEGEEGVLNVCHCVVYLSPKKDWG